MRCLMLFVPLVACGVTGSSSEAPAPPPVDEPAGQVAVARPAAVDAARLVPLGGGVTEIVYALGLGEQVVATDSSSSHPAPAAAKATLGHYRRLQAEGVLAQRPSAVLASDGSGPPESLAQLRAAGVNVVEVPEARTLDEARQRIHTVSALLDAQSEGDALVARIDAELAAITAALEGRDRPRVLFVYARGGGTLLVAGDKTSAGTLIALAGGTLASSGHEGFRPLTSEAVVAAAPDAVLLTTGGLETLGGEGGVLGLPGLAATPAGRNGRVLAIDDLLLLGFGVRLPEAVRQVARGLHPQVEL